MDFLKYDSPFSQTLMRIADMIILNLLYLLCCIPIFTIGAAQAGIYTAAKVMMDKEDDSSLTKAFFRGFKAGFGTITLAWGLIGLLLALLIYVGVMAIMLGSSPWPTLIGIALVAIYQAILPAFHSRFENTPKLLMRNTLHFILAFPLQTVAAGLLLWAPVLAFAFLDLQLFLALTPVWMLFYYSTAMVFGYWLMKKPFGVLIEQYESSQESAE